MTFTNQDKQKALTIVRVFETGKAAGDFGAVAVLNDGAGVSYGINQFTHRSGSLHAVVDRYFELGGAVARNVIERRLELLRNPSVFNIRWLAADIAFKKALKAAAISSEMKAAQTQIAEERFLRPAIDECERLEFTSALSLAVVYDSITHGSWEKIRDRIVEKPQREKRWITEYVRRRDAWLGSIPRLEVTRYRTKFFLDQIAIANWDLRLPLRVHRVKIDTEMLARTADIPVRMIAQHEQLPTASGGADKSVRAPVSAVGPKSQTTTDTTHDPQQSHQESSETPQAQPPGFLDEVERRVAEAAAKFDTAERVVITIADRTDRAKSLWMTFLGTIWQTLWAVIGWLADVPREVWLVVAIIAGALMLLYLYRQIALGKIREFQVPGSRFQE